MKYLDAADVIAWANERLEMDRTPHAQPVWKRLVHELESGRFDAVVVEPGRCPSRLELKTVGPDGKGGLVHGAERYVCVLRATHAGLHRSVEPDGRPSVDWTDDTIGATR